MVTTKKKQPPAKQRCPECTVSASGHCGEIDLQPGSHQIVYLQSTAATLPTIFGARQYVTIRNDGPGPMHVWIDTLPSGSVQLGGSLAGPPVPTSLPKLKPQAEGIEPTLTLTPGQSVTVAVVTVVIVGASRSPAKGCYVISWCCPTGLSLSVSVPDSPRLFEGIIAPGGGQRPPQSA